VEEGFDEEVLPKLSRAESEDEMKVENC